MNETTILREILAWLSAQPQTLAWRQNVGLGRTLDGRAVRFGVRGQADILACRRGRALAVEVKTATGRQSRAQRNFEAAWRAAGGVYVLARSVADLRDALAALDP